MLGHNCTKTDAYEQARQDISQPRQKGSSMHHLRPWSLELCSTALLIVAILAFVPTLCLHAGQPVPQWPPSVSINTLLSVYGLVLKSALVVIVTSCLGQCQWSWFQSPNGKPLGDIIRYQRAGAGAVGSFRCLFSRHIRQPLTGLGALITVLAIAIDPFIQQLVAHVDCSQPMHGVNASMPRTSYFNSSWDSMRWEPIESMTPSYMAAFFTTQNLTSFHCATGNCTFHDNYSTLGFCSRCEDITRDLDLTKDCTVTDGSTTTPTACDASTYGEPGQVFRMNITVASENLSLNWHGNITINSSDYFSGSDQFAAQVGGQYPCYINYTKCHSRAQHDITFLYLGYEWYESLATSIECNDTGVSTSWQCQGYGGAACDIRPCVRTYNASVDAGQLTEVLIEESDMDTRWGIATSQSLSSDYMGLVDLSRVSPGLQEQMMEAGYDIGEATRWTGFNLTEDPQSIFTPNSLSSLEKSLFDAGALYAMGMDFYASWANLVAETLGGTYGGMKESLLGSDSQEQLKQLFASDNVSAESIGGTMDNVAKAATLFIRSNGSPNFSEPALGTVEHYAICVKVTWAWFAFPASLRALTLVLLILTIVDTVRNDLPVWKSSPLAILFNGPPGRDWVDDTLLAKPPATGMTTEKGSQQNIGTPQEMGILAESISVRLGKEDNGHRLFQIMPDHR